MIQFTPGGNRQAKTKIAIVFHIQPAHGAKYTEPNGFIRANRSVPTYRIGRLHPVEPFGSDTSNRTAQAKDTARFDRFDIPDKKTIRSGAQG